MQNYEVEVPKGYDKTKAVSFGNGRITRGKRAPHGFSTKRSVFGNVVDFREIPLAKIEKRNKKEYFVPATDIRGEVLVYGKGINFVGGSPLILDPVTDFFVIQTLRDMPGTVSSKKSEEVKAHRDFKEVVTGWIIESEPEHYEAKAAQEEELTMEAMSVLNEIKRNEANIWTLRYTAAHTGASDNPNRFLASTKGYLEKQLKNVVDFMGFFVDHEETGRKIGPKGEVVMKPELRDKATISLAIKRGVIQQRDGLYVFGDNVSLGISENKILSLHRGKLGQIRSALEASYGK